MWGYGGVLRESSSSEYGGVKFVKAPWMTYGVPHMVFAKRFSDVVQNFHGEHRWVAFHSLYDLDHLVPLFTGKLCLIQRLILFC